MRELTPEMMEAGLNALQRARLSNLDDEATVMVIWQALWKTELTADVDCDSFIPENYDFETVL
jgi:hypothetical protein